MSKVLAEKPTRLERLTNMNKPVPMKLFAAWEVDRTPSDCIPRWVNVFCCLPFSFRFSWDACFRCLSIRFGDDLSKQRNCEYDLFPEYLTGIILPISLQTKHFEYLCIFLNIFFLISFLTVFDGSDYIEFKSNRYVHSYERDFDNENIS